MNIESFTSASMRSLVALAEKREKLLEQVQSLESEIAAILSNLPTKIATGKGRTFKSVIKSTRGSKVERKGQKPGALKERILEMLRAAGDMGVTVSEIAEELSIRPANVHVWFSTTGKRLEEVKKVAPGRFRFDHVAGKKSS